MECHEVGYAVFSAIMVLALIGWWMLIEGIKEAHRSKGRAPIENNCTED